MTDLSNEALAAEIDGCSNWGMCDHCNMAAEVLALREALAAADALADAAYQLLVKTGEKWTSPEVVLWEAASAYCKARGDA